ncbi:hypothetical protein ACROYT_G015196 [Oculina patagonica]
MFSLDSLDKRFLARKAFQEQLASKIAFLRGIDLSTMDVDEEEASLLILASKITFQGVIFLKAAIQHVPQTYVMKCTDSGGASLHLVIIYQLIWASQTFLSSLSKEEVDCYVNFVENNCANFLGSSLLPQERAQPGWGKDACKPDWWPSEVAFIDINNTQVTGQEPAQVLEFPPDVDFSQYRVVDLRKMVIRAVMSDGGLKEDYPKAAHRIEDERLYKSLQKDVTDGQVLRIENSEKHEHKRQPSPPTNDCCLALHYGCAFGMKVFCNQYESEYNVPSELTKHIHTCTTDDDMLFKQQPGQMEKREIQEFLAIEYMPSEESAYDPENSIEESIPKLEVSVEIR